jgi:hypothetical protein
MSLVTQTLFCQTILFHSSHWLKVPCIAFSVKSSTQSIVFHSVALVSSLHTPLHHSLHWFKEPCKFSSMPLILSSVNPAAHFCFHPFMTSSVCALYFVPYFLCHLSYSSSLILSSFDPSAHFFYLLLHYN